MIKLIARICLISCLFQCLPALYAGQYVKIEHVDLSASYPEARIILAVKGIQDSVVSDPDEKILSFYEDGTRIDEGIKVTKQSDTENLLYMVFSIDSSKSISKKFLASIKSAAREIVTNIGPNDKIAVYHFDDRVSLMNDFTRNADQIIKNINSIKRHGSKTLLYNSIFDSIELLEKVDQNNKKIIVFTDGKDEGSSVKDDDIIHLARASGIPVYFICLKDSSELGVMARISKLSGGKVVYSNRHDDVAGMYRTLLSIIKNRYIALYPSRLKRDGKDHVIEVRLNYGDIRDQDSYAAAAAGFNLWNIFPLNNVFLFAICLLFLSLLFIIIIYFLNREKNILKERFEIEKKLIAENILRAGGAKIQQEYDTQDKGLPADLKSQYARAWVYKKDGPGAGIKQQLISPEMTIGRDKDNDIVVNDESASPHHAKIKFMNGAYYLFDLISERGTFLNGKKMLRPKTLYDWDEITIGSTIFIFRGTMRLD